MTGDEDNDRSTHPAGKDVQRQQLWSQGRCGSMSRNGRLCNIKAHGQETAHRAEVLGGMADGRVLEEWDW
jgi:hypothetical protein